MSIFTHTKFRNLTRKKRLTFCFCEPHSKTNKNKIKPDFCNEILKSKSECEFKNLTLDQKIKIQEEKLKVLDNVDFESLVELFNFNEQNSDQKPVTETKKKTKTKMHNPIFTRTKKRTVVSPKKPFGYLCTDIHVYNHVYWETERQIYARMKFRARTVL